MSCEEDTVIDMDSDIASTFIATLKEGRNALWITFQSSVVQQTGDNLCTKSSHKLYKF